MCAVVVRKVSFRSRSLSPARDSPRPRDIEATPPSQSPSRRDPGYTARRSLRSASPRRRKSPPKGTATVDAPRAKNRQSVEDKENIIQRGNSEVRVSLRGVPPSSSLSREEKMLLEKGWDSSWSQDDRKQIWNMESRLERGVQLRERDNASESTPNPRKKILTSYTGQVRRRLRKSKRADSSWQPPSLSALDQQAVKLDILPPILPPQQSAIRDWLFTLGLSVRDGEGGFLQWSGQPGASLPQLKEDRIRNGELLCDLVATLEPNAATHAQLTQLVNRKPATISLALENIERALWLLRIRKCPPIPVVYLCHPMAVIEAHKALLWGLLQEIMQAYPLCPHNGGSKGGVSLLVDQPITRGSAWSNSLPYSISDRKALDQSLMQWLVEEEILSGIMKGLLPADMPSIATLEGPLRDGTLLCLLTGKILGSPVMGWSRKARSFSSSVANLRKCTQALRGRVNMSTRFLYNGVEEDIAKGEWSAMLGLLEDMHRLRDGVPPPRENSDDTKRHEHKRPYLGRMAQEWPPDMTGSDGVIAGRKFTACSFPETGTHYVNLAHNIPPHIMDTDENRTDIVQKPKLAIRSSSPPLRWDMSATTRKSDMDLFPGHTARAREESDADGQEYIHNRERYFVRGGGQGVSTSGDIFPSTTVADGQGAVATQEEGEDNTVRNLRLQYQQQQRGPPRREGVVPDGRGRDDSDKTPSLQKQDKVPEKFSEPQWNVRPPVLLDIAPGTSVIMC